MMYTNHRKNRARCRTDELVNAYIEWCDEHYESREPGNMRCALARLTLYSKFLDLASWYHALRELGAADLSMSYKRACHRRWLGMLSWATEYEMIDASMLHRLQQIRFKPSPKASRIQNVLIINQDWCEDFRAKFWATTPLMPKWLREISTMCFYTGARPKEIYTLTTASINTHQTQRVIVLKTHKTSSKTHTPRYIALNRPARLIIDRKLKPFCPDDWLWPAARDCTKHVSYCVVNQALKRIIARNGLRPWTLYDCRRHAASMAVSQASPAAAQAMLGHRDLRTTSIYTIPSLNDAVLGAQSLEACNEG